MPLLRVQTFFKITFNGVDNYQLVPTVDFPAGGSQNASAQNLVAAINSSSSISQNVFAVWNGANKFNLVSWLAGSMAAPYIFKPPVSSNYLPATNTPFTNGTDNTADKALYNTIKSMLSNYTLELYPSAAMAGVYTSVDGDRGVWKAPANVSLAMVNEPGVLINDDDQGLLNVDPGSGKSINAIRKFTGRGIMVWGSRTLAGNDNEWRYINVKRLFIYVEESIKKATEFVVFEPNTAATWQRIKSMSEAFLTGLWRDGGLAGATAKDAFFVRVGLGTTMTPQDILEGRMIVEIGMAASRPAEFIILRFSHKLQES